MRNTLEGMTRNALFGDLAVLRDRDLLLVCSTVSYYVRLEDDYRKGGGTYKKLISVKATIRYYGG